MTFRTASLLAGLLLATAAHAQSTADPDPWAKVRALLSGVDLRVSTDGARPGIYKLDSVREDALILIRKNEQLSIQRADIKKIELQMPDALKHTQARVKSEFPRTPDGRVNKTTTGGIVLQTRDGDYLLIYRRPDRPGKR